MKIITIPFSGGGLGHGNGANEAPEKILSHFEELYANERGQEPNYDIDKTLNEKINEKNINESHEEITNYVKTLREKAIFLGGDHSITQPTLKGFKQSLEEQGNKEELLYIVFDAHPDLMDDFRPPTQEDYLRVLIEEGTIKPENTILIGIRNWDKEELTYIKEKNITTYTMNDILKKGIVAVMNEVLEKAKTFTNIYLSIDIDAVDPVEAIGTGYLEHGGMSSRELIYAVQEIAKTGKLQGADVVEVNPKKDINDMTSKLAAKIVYELGEF
jgi:arginase family enzyme